MSDEERRAKPSTQISDSQFFHGSVQWSPESPTMMLIGEIDIASVPEMRRHLACIVAADEAADLTIDLAMVTFLDSTGLSFLVTTHKSLASKGGRLTIVRATPRIRSLFEITGLNEVLNIIPLHSEGARIYP
jgi:anti-sigma B factor antagonist